MQPIQLGLSSQLLLYCHFSLLFLKWYHFLSCEPHLRLGIEYPKLVLTDFSLSFCGEKAHVVCEFASFMRIVIYPRSLGLDLCLSQHTRSGFLSQSRCDVTGGGIYVFSHGMKNPLWLLWSYKIVIFVRRKDLFNWSTPDNFGNILVFRCCLANFLTTWQFCWSLAAFWNRKVAAALDRSTWSKGDPWFTDEPWEMEQQKDT